MISMASLILSHSVRFLGLQLHFLPVHIVVARPYTINWDEGCNDLSEIYSRLFLAAAAAALPPGGSAVHAQKHLIVPLEDVVKQLVGKMFL